jgi:low temperature requirement protein LtrA
MPETTGQPAREPSLFRIRGTAHGDKVENIELFYDLVFVFAVTRLSHMLLKDLSPGGALRTGLLIVAVWWVWIYTTWVTNWLAPERVPVRLCLFALMFAGLVMSVSIPHAFDTQALHFALAYVFMQVGRTAFFLWAAREAPHELRQNFQRILAWMCLSSAFWIWGALSPSRQLDAWCIALGLELLGPVFYFWTPGLGRSRPEDWNISGVHLAERCGLFVIIALGESLLVTGMTFSGLEWTPAALAALASAALGSILMWWIYFDTGAVRGHHRIAHSQEPGRQARLAYTYLHLLIIAGIIVSAVSDELVLASTGHGAHGGDGDHGASTAWIVILAGPMLYIFGTAMFKWVTNDRRTPPLSHVVGLALLLALLWPAKAHLISTLGLGIATTGTLLVVAVWESMALARPATSGPAVHR